MTTIFDFVTEEIERKTELGRLQARGTVRLALKESGFSADAITAQQMAVILERVMSEELGSRGVKNAESICSSLAIALREFKDAVEEQGGTSPENVFRRLADG